VQNKILGLALGPNPDYSDCNPTAWWCGFRSHRRQPGIGRRLFKKWAQKPYTGQGLLSFSINLTGSNRNPLMADTRKNKTPTGKPGPGINWMSILWIVLIWMLLANLFNLFFGASGFKKISYTDFKKDVENGKVAEITIRKDKIQGTFVGGDKTDQRDTTKRFQTVLPSIDDPGLIKLLEENKVEIKAESAESPLLTTLLISLLPWVLIIGFFVYSSKKMGKQLGGFGNPFNFAKSKAKRFNKMKVEITFKDVAGLENPKHELLEIIEFLKNPDKFQALGSQLPKGVLLVGPPGNGKTLMARATAGEAGVPFYSISGSEFIEMFVGVGASRVRDMFENAKKEAPSIIFIDEIDSIGRVRGTGLGGGHDEREQTLNQILSEMDGFDPNESVIVMAATNRPDVLDPALIRPGRFDRQVTLDLPHRQARQDILELHAKKTPLADDVDLAAIARQTVGFSGADLKNLVNEASLIAARQDKKKVEMTDFEEGRDKITLGLEREERITDEEKEMIAYHEAGHTLVAMLLPGTDPIQKVTIVPRGRAMGATEQMPKEDRHNLGRHFLQNRLAVMLGGHAAEKLVYKDITSGAGDDLKKASQLARRMVCQWGMSDKLGPVAFRQGEPHPFLGRELSEPKDYSEDTARIIDEEVQNFLREAEKLAEEKLKENRQQLDALAAALLEHESLSGDEVRATVGIDDKAKAQAKSHKRSAKKKEKEKEKEKSSKDETI
jgi:cell division protease FtsH